MGSIHIRLTFWLCLFGMLVVCGASGVVAAEAGNAPEDDQQALQSRFRQLTAQAKQAWQADAIDQARKHYEQALELLQSLPPEQARQAVWTNRRQRLYYNLGSVCYRQQDWRTSRAYFLKLQRHPKMAALANYNLALIANRQGKRQEAIAYMRKSHRLARSASMRKLAAKQLHKLGVGKKPTAKPGLAKQSPGIDAYVYLGHGYDSNINFVPLGIGAGESGNFFQAIGLLGVPIAGNGTGRRRPVLSLLASGFLTNYYSSDFNDYGQAELGLRYRTPVSGWRFGGSLHLKHSSYGHRDYQRNGVFELRLDRILGKADFLDLRYRYEQITTPSQIYRYLEGNRHQLRASLRFKWSSDQLTLGYLLEKNNRRNTRKRNYSPLRNRLHLRYQKALGAAHKLYIDVAYRRSDYEPTPTQDRLDNRNDLELGWLYAPDKHWQFRLRGRDTHNRSTDTVFSYDRRMIMLNLRYRF